MTTKLKVVTQAEVDRLLAERRAEAKAEKEKANSRAEKFSRQVRQSPRPQAEKIQSVSGK